MVLWLFQAGATGGESRGMLPILDLRLEYLIDGVLFVHACTSMVANRGYAFRETPLVDDAERVRSFVPFFRTFMAYRIFPSATCATRSPHDIRRDWKGLSATRNAKYVVISSFVYRKVKLIVGAVKNFFSIFCYCLRAIF